MDAVLIAAGLVVILAVAQDVFSTVLFPASSRGIIRKPVSRAVWGLFRLAARTTGGQRRRNLLSYAGPTVITLTIATWFTLLVLGWAMLYKPGMGTSITASSGPTDTGWLAAVYFSGVGLTTLGVGDLAAGTGGYRLLVVTQAATGFAVISMVVTYFLSVYRGLVTRNSFAQGLHHRTQGTGDAVEILTALADDGELAGAREDLSSEARFLREVYQTHGFSPVLRYFHYREPLYSLPRVILVALDTASLLRSALDEDRYAGAIGSRALAELDAASKALLEELGSERRDAASPASVPAPDAEAWRRRHAAAAVRLAGVGLVVRRDLDEGADLYVRLRSTWDGSLRQLADSMGYEWEVVDPTAASGDDEPTTLRRRSG